MGGIKYLYWREKNTLEMKLMLIYSKQGTVKGITLRIQESHFVQGVS